MNISVLAVLCVSLLILAKPIEARDEARKKKASSVPGNQGSDIVIVPRSPDHKKAYADRPERGEHLNIKVTPPYMKRNGRPGEILVEVYNYSNYHISALRFDVELVTPKGWDKFEANIDVGELAPQWSDAIRIKIPGGKIDKITELKVNRLEIFGAGAKTVKLPLFTELIDR